jgi:small RNA 2'-O-methyltransferase
VLRGTRKERRGAGAAKRGEFLPLTRVMAPPGHGEEETSLHHERLDTVCALLRDARVRSVLDLGCGSGALLRRLVTYTRFTRVVGLDHSAEALRMAEHALASAVRADPSRVTLLHASFLDPDPALIGLDAATLVETIEHIAPERLGELEHAVFGVHRPRVVVVTTPNREFNVRYGIAPGGLRHPDHRFEWDRARFDGWARGVGDRNGYGVTTRGVGPNDPWIGAPTQMAVFERPR